MEYYETPSDALEKVQRRVARWVTGMFHMYSLSTMMQDIGWRDLNQRKVESQLCMPYKISQDKAKCLVLTVDILIGQYLKCSRDVHFQTIYAGTKC